MAAGAEILSEEELGFVLSSLDYASLLRTSVVCSAVRQACEILEESLWRRLLIAAPFWNETLCRQCPEREGLSSKDRFRVGRCLQSEGLPDLAAGLRFAADGNNLGLLHALVRARADPNEAADFGAHGVGFTQVGAYPLHLAAKRSHISVLEALMKVNAGIDVRDQNGRTALMIASASGQMASTAWLLEKRASVDVASDFGYTALHFASLLPRPDLVECLLGAGSSAEASETSTVQHAPIHVVLAAVPARPAERAMQQSNSCDPSGYGDEYCYDRNISHGYGTVDSAAGQQKDEAVRRAVHALLEHGADVDARDAQGRTCDRVLGDKRRPELQAWLAAEVDKQQRKRAGTPGAPVTATSQKSTESRLLASLRLCLPCC
mmetsp:Transcript_10022/g.22486  ORF Transcript_10022/g.22486 Transcript_10022/m.22486 type:complete len:378 (-) Transcript_10022:7-1140(-)